MPLNTIVIRGVDVYARVAKVLGLPPFKNPPKRLVFKGKATRDWALAELAKAFDPDQPRNKQGEWSVEGQNVWMDIRDSYRGDHYGSIYADTPPEMATPSQAAANNIRVGKLDFAGNDARVRIQYVETHADFRRRGVATRMLDKLKAEFPKAKIEWGGMTPDGVKLKASFKKYSPDQSRDYHGRFGSGGAPVSPAFNDMCHSMVQRLFPHGYDVSDNAPNTYEDLVKRMSGPHARMAVYSGASNQTIFGNAKANYDFRAWHDYCHLRGMGNFTPEGEHIAFEEQVKDVRRYWGYTPDADKAVNLLHEEIEGQLTYAQKHSNNFPVNQRAFAEAYLKDPVKAVRDDYGTSEIAKRNVQDDANWGRLRDVGMPTSAPSHAAKALSYRLRMAEMRTWLWKYSETQPRDFHGRWSAGSGSQFVSPNVANLSFAQAHTALAGGEQARTLQALADVDKLMGMETYTTSAIGAWKDGAENSTIGVTKNASWEQLKTAGAMKGYLTNQKAVLVFQPGTGNQFLANFEAKGSLEDVHKRMLEKGLEGHTLEPTEAGIRVHVYGEDQATVDKVRKAANDEGSTPKVFPGHGEFVGTGKQDGTDAEQRADARQKYEAIIGLSGVRGAAAGWQRLRDNWSAPTKDKPVVMVFGGSFNPPHMGHVGAVRDAVSHLQEQGYKVDKTVVTPSADKLISRKLEDRAYPLEDRVNLTSMAFHGIPNVEVTGAPAKEAEKAEGKLRRTQLADWARKQYPNHTVIAVSGQDAAPGAHPPRGPAVYKGDPGTAHEGYNYLVMPREPEGGMRSSPIRHAIRDGKEPPPGWLAPGALSYIHGMFAKNPKIKKSDVLALKKRIERIREVLKFFNPNQPRDKDGKWTSGGVSAALAPTGERKTGIGPDGYFHVSDADKLELHAMLDRHASIEEISQHPAIVMAQKEAESLPRTDLLPGYGTLEREQNRAFVDPITERQFTGYRSAEDYLTKTAKAYAHGEVEKKREATIILGPPAAGKSDFAEKLAVSQKAAIVDPDDAKKIMPEYRGGIGAHAVHEESSDLSKAVLKNLVVEGSNLILPKVGGSQKSIAVSTAGLKAAGYHVNLVNMRVSEENALQRSVARFASTGRLINLNYTKEVDGNPTRTYHALKVTGDYDQVVGIDNNHPKGQYVIEEGRQTAIGRALDSSR